MEDYEKVYTEFWEPLVTNEDGSVNLDQVKRELSDWHFAMEQVSIVYSEITNGMLSKPNYYASGVLSAAEEANQQVKEWAIEDFLSANYEALANASTSYALLDIESDKGSELKAAIEAAQANA